MKKILSFQTPTEHYTAHDCLVWCFDDRFTPLLDLFSRGLGNFDLVKVAGGAKALAGDPLPDRDFVLGQIKASVKLHGVKRIILMTHRDCGAYGGSKAFTSGDAERGYHEAQLIVAKKFVESELPGVQVEAYFADADGLYAAG
jgi:carbonic anhydrase